MQRRARLKTVAGVHQTRRQSTRAVIQKIIKNNWKTARRGGVQPLSVYRDAQFPWLLPQPRTGVVQSGLIRANKYWIAAVPKVEKKVDRLKTEYTPPRPKNYAEFRDVSTIVTKRKWEKKYANQKESLYLDIKIFIPLFTFSLHENLYCGYW